MEHIGYSLIDAMGVEVQVWGTQKGVLVSLPNEIKLPNGGYVHAARPGEQLGDWKLVERWLEDAPPSRWHARIGEAAVSDGSRVVVTTLYESEPTIVPNEVSATKVRLALEEAGLLAQVEASVSAAGEAVKINWEFEPAIHRNSQLIKDVGAALGLDPAVIDALFRRAAEL